MHAAKAPYERSKGALIRRHKSPTCSGRVGSFRSCGVSSMCTPFHSESGLASSLAQWPCGMHKCQKTQVSKEPYECGKRDLIHRQKSPTDTSVPAPHAPCAAAAAVSSSPAPAQFFCFNFFFPHPCCSASRACTPAHARTTRACRLPRPHLRIRHPASAHPACPLAHCTWPRAAARLCVYTLRSLPGAHPLHFVSKAVLHAGLVVELALLRARLGVLRRVQRERAQERADERR